MAARGNQYFTCSGNVSQRANQINMEALVKQQQRVRDWANESPDYGTFYVCCVVAFEALCGRQEHFAQHGTVGLTSLTGLLTDTRTGFV